MYALTLDFRRREDNTKWAGIALLVAALAAGVAAGGEYLQLSDELDAAKASVREAAAGTRKKTSAVVASAEPQVLAAEIKHANAIMRQLTLPWGELFASAESTVTPEVALLSIESETDKRRVKISGEAKNLESILGYLRYLEARPSLVEVYLQSHELQKQDKEQPVRFVVSAEWKVRK